MKLFQPLLPLIGSGLRHFYAWDSGVACVCTAALVFSFAALFVKLMGSTIPVFEIVAFRSVISFTVCAAYAHAASIKPLFGRRANLRFLISRGLFGAAAMTTYYFSIKMLPLADAVTLFFLNPAITAVAAWAIMKEPLGFHGVGGIIISLCGLLLLTRPPFLFNSRAANSTSGDGLHGDASIGVGIAGSGDVDVSNNTGGGWDKQRLLGSMFGLLSALLSTGAFISIRFIGKSEPALVVSVYFHVSAAATSLVPLAAGLPTPAVWPKGVQWALLLGVAACSFWGQILIGRSFQLLNAARASAINLTQVVYSYLLGLIFLHEQLTLLGGAGSVLIAAGAVLVNLRPKTPPASTTAPAATDGTTTPGADGTEAAAAGEGKGASIVAGGGMNDGAEDVATAAAGPGWRCRRPVGGGDAVAPGAVELAGLPESSHDVSEGSERDWVGEWPRAWQDGRKAEAAVAAAAAAAGAAAAAAAEVDLEERRPLVASSAELDGRAVGSLGRQAPDGALRGPQVAEEAIEAKGCSSRIGEDNSCSSSFRGVVIQGLTGITALAFAVQEVKSRSSNGSSNSVSDGVKNGPRCGAAAGDAEGGRMPIASLASACSGDAANNRLGECCLQVVASRDGGTNALTGGGERK
ncbi:hypothetical protein Vretimale_9838 [Volvox reticuliferus]|uniref:EamA domain-containing protein n=1 Tax=Volvox reticuliferus TaxID=1737510 RepID=A0A8J4CKJ8_9CHLO|nr:hypothetical protein Vretifemale_13621 [Volvox reticuliferus]GIM05366.1 hypothetical protein Vretimale_9838 [Volvox reticuliferus]